MINLKRSSFQSRRKFKCVFFVLPALVVIFVFFLFPMIRTLQYSFTDWDGISRDIHWIGLKNFNIVLTGRSFKQVVFNTFFLVLVYVPVLNIFCLLLSVRIYDLIKFGTVFRSLLFFPNLLSMTVVGFIWKLIYSYDGVANLTLSMIGLDFLMQDWLGQAGTVMPALSVTILWFAAGYYLLIYFAGINSISTEIFDSAKVAGVNRFQRLFYIIIPLIAPSITINMILSTMGILGLFDLPFVLTRGGPGYMSETIAMRIYFYAFQDLRINYALALAVLLAIITIIITLILLVFLRKREEFYL